MESAYLRNGFFDSSAVLSRAFRAARHVFYVSADDTEVLQGLREWSVHRMLQVHIDLTLLALPSA